MRCLVNSLVGEGSRAGDNADATALVDKSGHDADFALARRLVAGKLLVVCRTPGERSMTYNDSGAVRPDQSTLVLGLQHVDDTNHIVLGDSFSDADNEADLSCNGLLNGGCGD